MNRSAIRLLAAIAAIGLAALAVPASAAAPAYAPGDRVTVEGATVTVPAPGNSVAMVIDRVDADATTLIVATSADGSVTVSRGSDAADHGSSGHGTATENSPHKCVDTSYSFLTGAAWQGAYEWRFRQSTTPDEFTKAKARNALRASVDTITDARNRCGAADVGNATNIYRGTTNDASNVTSEPACVPNPDDQNVSEFGPIGGTGVLAVTCVYTTPDRIWHADVRFNTNFTWWLSGPCHDAIGLKAVATHEYGHAFGIGHVDEASHRNLTMSTGLNNGCSNFEASLGKGDVRALNALY